MDKNYGYARSSAYQGSNTARGSSKPVNRRVSDMSYTPESKQPEMIAEKQGENEHVFVNAKKNDKMGLCLFICFHIIMVLTMVLLVAAVGIILNIILNTPKPYGSTCSTDADCITKIGLSCVSSMCDCKSTNFFTGSSCEPKLTYNRKCIYSKQCDSSLNLICDTTNSVCACNGATTWNNATCA